MRRLDVESRHIFEVKDRVQHVDAELGAATCLLTWPLFGAHDRQTLRENAIVDPLYTVDDLDRFWQVLVVTLQPFSFILLGQQARLLMTRSRYLLRTCRNLDIDGLYVL